MLLLQKNIDIKLEQTLRVKGAIALNTRLLAIANSATLTLYDLTAGTPLATTAISQWECLLDLQEDDQGIVEIQYHPYLETLLVIISGVKDGRKCWCLCQVGVVENAFTKSQLLYSTGINVSKYESMELKPKIIVLPLSGYFVFLRQFYMDSLAIVFNSGKQTQQFYLNEESLGSYDDKSMLVSFRSLFKNRIDIYLLDISAPVQTGKYGNIVNYSPEYGSVGVVLAVRRTANNQMLIILNDKKDIVVYLTYHPEADTMVKKVYKENSRVLHFFYLDETLMLSIQKVKKDILLLLETPTASEKDKIQEDLLLEDWNVNASSRQTLICNHSQDRLNGELLHVRLKRVVGLQETRLAMQREFLQDDSLLEQINGLMKN